MINNCIDEKKITLSIVVTFYKNISEVNEVIDSICKFVGSSIHKVEIILINDSADNSILDIKNEKSLNIKSFNLYKNLGVTGARNYGYTKAISSLVLFFDSDDRLISDSLDKVLDFINQNIADIYFFRCLDENNKLIGLNQIGIEKSTSPNFNYGKGERIICVKKNNKLPFIEFLRGCENTGLLFYSIKCKKLSFCWADFPIRIYRNNINGLSSKINTPQRSFLISIGHLLSSLFSLYFKEYKWSFRFFISFIYRVLMTIKILFSNSNKIS
jgi:glycosyltransferase involved in cell wall biosynthesis